MKQPRSWTAKLLGFAISVFAAALLLHTAAQLLLAVWPVLAGGLVVSLGVVALWRGARYRDYW